MRNPSIENAKRLFSADKQVAATDIRIVEAAQDLESAVGSDHANVFGFDKRARIGVGQVNDVHAAAALPVADTERVVDVADEDTQGGGHLENAVARGIRLRKHFGHAIFRMDGGQVERPFEYLVHVLAQQFLAPAFHAARFHHDHVMPVASAKILGQVQQRESHTDQQHFPAALPQPFNGFNQFLPVFQKKTGIGRLACANKIRNHIHQRRAGAFCIGRQQCQYVVIGQWAVCLPENLPCHLLVETGVVYLVAAARLRGGAAALENRLGRLAHRSDGMVFVEIDGQKRNVFNALDSLRPDFQKLYVFLVNGIVPGLETEQVQGFPLK